MRQRTTHIYSTSGGRGGVGCGDYDDSNYELTISSDLLNLVNEYMSSLARGGQPGALFERVFLDKFHCQKRELPTQIARMTMHDFLRTLPSIRTSIPIEAPDIAKSQLNLKLDGTDFTPEEFEILSRLSILIHAQAYSSGLYAYIDEREYSSHNPPRHVILLCASPPVILQGFPGFARLVHEGSLRSELYAEMLRKILMPGIARANRFMNQRGCKGILVVPAFGCSPVSGSFEREIPELLHRTFLNWITNNRRHFDAFAAVMIDTFQSYSTQITEIDGVVLVLHPSGGKIGHLSDPEDLWALLPGSPKCPNLSFVVKVVSVEATSPPGGMYSVSGQVRTDHEAVAASTNMLTIVTGIAGRYTEHSRRGKQIGGAYKHCGDGLRADITWSTCVNEQSVKVVPDSVVVLTEQDDRLGLLERNMFYNDASVELTQSTGGSAAAGSAAAASVAPAALPPIPTGAYPIGALVPQSDRQAEARGARASRLRDMRQTPAPTDSTSGAGGGGCGDMSGYSNYELTISIDVLYLVDEYMSFLAAGGQPGALLKSALLDKCRCQECQLPTQIAQMTIQNFITTFLSVRTRVVREAPHIARSQLSLKLDGTDFTPREFEILSRLSILIHAEAYNSGVWFADIARFTIVGEYSPHNPPKYVILLCASFPVLLQGFPGYAELVKEGSLIPSKYGLELCKRLMPAIARANRYMHRKGYKGILVVPAFGCSTFPGSFEREIPALLFSVFRDLILRYKNHFNAFASVFIDTFRAGIRVVEYPNGLPLVQGGLMNKYLIAFEASNHKDYTYF